MIIDELRKDTVYEFLKNGRRIDGRGFDEIRPIRVERDVISSAEGSARAHIGDTQVLVGVKVALSIPFKDKPAEGMLTVGADLLPLASPTFESGPPSEDAIELARVVDRGIRSAEAIDLKALYIEEEKVWGVYIDIYVLDHDGNLIDASALGAVAALDNMRMPKYIDGDVNREETTLLPLREKPTYCTFSKIKDNIIIDPSYIEGVAEDSRLTVAVGDENVYAMQKAGRGSFTRDEVLLLIDKAFEKRKELIKHI